MKLPAQPSFSVWHGGAFAIALLAGFLVLTSAQRQSVTIDESNHFYCGLEWWQNGTYTAWPENPPLSRAIVALGPYLNGYRVASFTPDSLTTEAFFMKSYDLNYFSQGSVSDDLFWIRIFILPLFLLSVWVVWIWAIRLGGPAAGFLAVGMYATLPPIMAHSGLATTDITFVATFTLTMWLFARWLSRPSLLNGTWLGLALASALLAKYSVLIYFPVAALLMLILFLIMGRNRQEQPLRSWCTKALKSGSLAGLVMVLTVWAFFGFSFGAIGDQPVIQAAIAEGTLPATLNSLYVPAPEWFAGLRLLMNHNAQGHPAYALGNMSITGFWYFFPLTWLVKTPWTFMLLTLAGFVGAWGQWKGKRNWESMALTVIPVVILLSVLNSHINIGIRHILVVYPLGAVGAATGLLRLLQHIPKLTEQGRKLIPAGLVVWQATIAFVAFPNYLSYFNGFGKTDPGSVLVDSDLDWGQGLFELSQYAQEQKIDTLHLAYFGLAQDCWYDLPAIQYLPADTVVHGWIAVSESIYQGAWNGDLIAMGPCQLMVLNAPGTGDYSKGIFIHQNYRWLDAYPVAKKLGGGSIRVYHVPEDNAKSQAVGKLQP